MNKLEIIKIAAEKSGVSRKDTAKVLSAILDTILEGIQKDEEVRLLNFGTFSVKKHGVRNGYNPATRKVVIYPERKVVRFKITKRFNLE